MKLPLDRMTLRRFAYNVDDVDVAKLLPGGQGEGQPHSPAPRIRLRIAYANMPTITKPIRTQHSHTRSAKRAHTHQLIEYISFRQHGPTRTHTHTHARRCSVLHAHTHSSPSRACVLKGTDIVHAIHQPKVQNIG